MAYIPLDDEIKTKGKVGSWLMMSVLLMAPPPPLLPPHGAPSLLPWHELLSRLIPPSTRPLARRPPLT
jgi:hypothetical protein